MSGVCQKHERYIPEGEECPYCETVAVVEPPRPSDACRCGVVSMSGLAAGDVELFAGGVHSREDCARLPSPAARLYLVQEAIRSGTITQAQAAQILVTRETK